MDTPSMIAEYPLLQFVLWEIFILAAIYGFLYSTLVIPERKRRQEVSDRLTRIEQEQAASKLWREHHERSHCHVNDKIEKIIASQEALFVAVQSIDKNQALLEERSRQWSQP